MPVVPVAAVQGEGETELIARPFRGVGANRARGPVSQPDRFVQIGRRGAEVVQAWTGVLEPPGALLFTAYQLPAGAQCQGEIVLAQLEGPRPGVVRARAERPASTAAARSAVLPVDSPRRDRR